MSYLIHYRWRKRNNGYIARSKAVYCYFILWFSFGVCGWLSANNWTYNFWTNLYSLLVMSIGCFFIWILILCPADPVDTRPSHGMYLYIILVFGSFMMNLCGKALFRNDPSENDYWLRIIFSYAFSAAGLPFDCITNVEVLRYVALLHPERIMYALGYLFFIIYAFFCVNFFEDVVFDSSEDAHVWFCRLVIINECCNFCNRLRKAHARAGGGDFCGVITICGVLFALVFVGVLIWAIWVFIASLW
eukprot:TRINITY_DN776345_c0_g1_i1.p1 TRINITY_DN776345_c0_g1~~TRINITY_DN776345_c0_g1_i1.p1  ORF type:complete len:260 (+),score=7.44 TRINITY_DN776345_c0_g1_i1:44-781(+)